MLKNKENVLPIIFAILLYIPTFYGVPDVMALALPVLLVLIYRHALIEKSKNWMQNPFTKESLIWVGLPALIMIASFLNKLFNGQIIYSLKDYYAAFYLLPAVLITASLLPAKKVFFWIVPLVLIEVLVGILEYLWNVRSFWNTVDPLLYIKSKDLLYDSRVYGFSSNSPIFGLKIFIAFLILDAQVWKNRTIWGIRIFLILGLLLTFNRAVLVAVFLFAILRFAQLVIDDRKKYKGWISKSTLRIGLVSIFLTIVFYKPFIYQFSRGESVDSSGYGEEFKELKLQETETIFAKMDLTSTEKKAKILKNESELDLTGWFSKSLMKATANTQTSGRKLIWLNYADYLDEHLWFGNGSDKLKFKTYDQAKRKIVTMHAHNSFIELLCSNGLIIFMLYLFLYFSLWRKCNVIAITCILVYSMFQYGIFWGYSFLDVVFIIFLTTPLIDLKIGNSRANS
ncbi:MAG: O-antigen ligase family protein [Bacteroidetes bacterium]|nr:O-antigen ligase family protein [Bacteroidota bacterium]